MVADGSDSSSEDGRDIEAFKAFGDDAGISGTAVVPQEQHHTLVVENPAKTDEEREIKRRKNSKFQALEILHRREAEKNIQSALVDPVWKYERSLTMWERADLKRRVYAVMEIGSFPSDISANAEMVQHVVALTAVIAILLSCASILALSYPVYNNSSNASGWNVVEVLVVIAFTVDLTLRGVTCPRKALFFKDPFNWTDFTSIAPFYAQLFGISALPWFIRIFRVLRLARMIKIFEAYRVVGLKSLLLTIQRSASGLLFFFLLAFVIVLQFATWIYFTERGVWDATTNLWMQNCRNCFGNGYHPSPFQSVGGALWYAVNVLTTTGSGELVVVTTFGRFLTAVGCLAAIFVIGIPTMVLAGNHVASIRAEAVPQRSWRQIQTSRRVQVKEVATLERLRKYMGWETDDLECSSPSDQRPSQPFAKVTAGPKSKVIGLFQLAGRVHELRQPAHDPNEYVYDPLIHFVADAAGRPRGVVHWANNGMPTVVSFEIVVDSREAREEAMKIVRIINKTGWAHCDSYGGFKVSHHHPLSGLTKTVRIAGVEKADPVIHWRMLDTVIRSGFGDDTFAVYFTRSGAFWDDPLDHQNDRDRFSEEEMLEDCYASLLGSSLLIEQMMPLSGSRRRVMILQQLFQGSRLHRELEVLAQRGNVDADHEKVAYIHRDDFFCLIEGVHRRIDLVDPSISIADGAFVDRLIAQVLLRRYRTLKYLAVPTKFEKCVFNAEVLAADDEVVEIPMTFFEGDVDDEVELDILSFININLNSFFGSGIRLDFTVSLSSVPKGSTLPPALLSSLPETPENAELPAAFRSPFS
jgi:hypothetical protein